MNVDTIRTDIPTSSAVTDVIVWNIEQSGTDTLSATYEVDQQIKEREQTTAVNDEMDRCELLSYENIISEVKINYSNIDVNT